MSVAGAVQSIQLLLTPVLMISACGLLLLTMQNRYGRINDRLRELARERIEFLDVKTRTAKIYIETIGKQVPELLERNKILRNALVSIFLAVVCFIAVTFFIALAVLNTTQEGAPLAFWTFILGLGFVFLGMMFMVRESFISHRAVTYESEEIMNLKADGNNP